MNTTKLRSIKVEFYKTPTTARPRVRLIEEKTINFRERDKNYYDYDYEKGTDILKESVSILEKKGFNIVGYVNYSTYYLIMVDNSAEDFIRLKQTERKTMKTDTTKPRSIKVEFYTTKINDSSRIRLSEDSTNNRRQKLSFDYPFDYEIGDIFQQATEILQEKGFNIVSYVENSNYYLILVDNSGNEYITLK